MSCAGRRRKSGVVFWMAICCMFDGDLCLEGCSGVRAMWGQRSIYVADAEVVRQITKTVLTQVSVNG